MNATHFLALIKNAFISFGFGLLYVFIVFIFCNDVVGAQPFNLMIGTIFTFISCGVINVIVLPIITLIDRKTMDIKTFKELLLRYMPIFATPFMLAYTLFVLAEGVDLEIVMHVFIVMLVSYTNLYVYLSFVKATVEKQNTILTQS